MSGAQSIPVLQFLSTLPARGATMQAFQDAIDMVISIHAPREGSDRGRSPAQGPGHHISIHAPREGSDRIDYASIGSKKTFLSTLPARGATQGGQNTGDQISISIHAPREGSDRDQPPARRIAGHFYPRSPRGERQDTLPLKLSAALFLSTLPARGATRFIHIFSLFLQIFLSTLPARGATSCTCSLSSRQQIFLSTLPARGATPFSGLLSA